MKYVIIGNSTAAVGAIEGIRQIDKKGEIEVITNEPYHTYSRPLISYLLQGKVTRECMNYRDGDFYSRNNVKLTHADVSKIDAEAHRVILSDGGQSSYDKLLYAAGSTALIPEYEGLDTVRDKFTFMSLDDALKLDSVLGENKDKRVLIIGAGLIGLKCAEGILDKSKCVEVLARAPRILSSILDDAGAKIVQNHIESKGVKFRLGSKIERFEKNAVVLADSERLAFDILVIAAGARPNTELLSGIAEIDRGIIINEHTETTAPGIYAAGDCTQAVDVSSGENKVMAMLPNAYVQGECAGINMAGGDRTLAPAVPMNAIGLFGLHMLTAGTYSGETYSPGEDGTYKRLFYSDDRLNGYILIGDIKKAGIYTSLIRERTPLSTIDFELIRDNPGLIAFDKAHRAAKLGEVV